MKNRIGFHAIILPFIILGLFSCSQNPDFTTAENLTISNIIDGVVHEPGNWEPDLPAGKAGISRGNHRAVVKVVSAQQNVFVHIPWRRCDHNPEQKKIIVVNAETGKEIHNKLVLNSNNEFGEIIFQTDENYGIYHVYYMPFKSTGGYYPTVTYLAPETRAEKNWLDKINNPTKDAIA